MAVRNLRSLMLHRVGGSRVKIVKNMSSNDSTYRHVTDENNLISNTIDLLDEEKQNILTEVLKCDICLEIPRGKQVRICVEGHHFCITCHNQMKVCGICRGLLLECRNFVVEELVAKLSPILGIPKATLPASQPPIKLPPGSYPCLHGCTSLMAAFRLLPHMRRHHSHQFTDKLRMNPYTKRFSFIHSLFFKKNEKYVHTLWVSDLALFTLELTFTNWDFFGHVRGLGSEDTIKMLKHQLVLKIHPKKNEETSFEFALTDAPMWSYLDKKGDFELKVKGNDLLEHISAETTVSIFFSVWPVKCRKEKENITPSVVALPKRCLHFDNDRKIIRNRNRNMRRKRLGERLRASAVPDGSSSTLAKRVSNMTL